MSGFTEHHSRMQKPGEIMADALLDEIDALLQECTDKQKAMLDHVWPAFRSSSDAKKLTSVLELVQRTVSKNRSGRIDETVS